jgi:two-component system, NarL family, nitrate/nitrite response regulator NarL
VTEQRRIRVVVADDHPAMREELRETVEQDERFAVVAVAADGAGAVAAALRERPDVCLLDIRMPGSGIAATREITARLPDTKVVIITVSVDDDDLLNALRAGAVGYLPKDIDPHRLPEALHEAVEGGAAIPTQLVARLIAEFRDHGPRRRTVVSEVGYDLTSREWEVLNLLRQGRSTAEIASKLYVSHATVRSHVAAVLRKLRLPNRKALRALDNG